MFALYRFLLWKLIRIFSIKDLKYRLWDNRKIFLNYDSFQSMWIMYNYYVDWEEFNLICNYVQPADDVFDVGANMGFYTIWMSKFVSLGKIHSFEPDSKNFDRLQKNIALNNLESQVIANKKAVSNINGELLFTTGLDGENHIVDQSDKNIVGVESTRLNSYVLKNCINSIAYLKIDVEGFEYNVLKGADNILLNKKIDIIQLEINTTIDQSGKTIIDVLELLNGYAYYLCSYDVKTNELKKTPFSKERENYFAVTDLEKVNSRLRNSSKHPPKLQERQS